MINGNLIKIMKTIKLLVEVEVIDDYSKTEAELILTDAISMYYHKANISNVEIIKDEH